MSTILNTNGEKKELPALLLPGMKVLVATAEWNPQVTRPLRDGAKETLLAAGVKEECVECMDVPGTVELVNAAATAVHCGKYDSVIVIGCVIRGDTPHFDYVCMQAANGVAAINAEGAAPVIFGVLTVENLQQALDRAGGRLGNKGSEAAVAAIEMVNFRRRVLG